MSTHPASSVDSDRVARDARVRRCHTPGAVNFASFLARVEPALRGALPGRAAHEQLAPRPRREWPPGFSSDHIRHAAGLLLVFPIDDRPHTVLTLRADNLERHRGQVSLPGGAVDAGESFEHAALREAHEEIGLSFEDVRILGALTPVDIPVSGFQLHPVVAAADIRPAFTASSAEVARVLEVPIADLREPAHLISTTRMSGGRTIQVPAFRIGSIEIWGATAMILSEFLTLDVWR